MNLWWRCFPSGLLSQLERCSFTVWYKPNELQNKSDVHWSLMFHTVVFRYCGDDQRRTAHWEQLSQEVVTVDMVNKGKGGLNQDHFISCHNFFLLFSETSEIKWGQETLKRGGCGKVIKMTLKMWCCKLFSSWTEYINLIYLISEILLYMTQ